MENQKDSVKPTIILNKSHFDGFLDLSSASEMSEVMKALNKIMDESEENER